MTSPGDGRGERALWRACLEVMIRDALAPPDNEAGRAAQRQAAQWFESADMLTVCALAGLDGHAVHARWRADLIDPAQLSHSRQVGQAA